MNMQVACTNLSAICGQQLVVKHVAATMWDLHVFANCFYEKGTWLKGSRGKHTHKEQTTIMFLFEGRICLGLLYFCDLYLSSSFAHISHHAFCEYE